MPTIDNLQGIVAQAIADLPLDATFRPAMQAILVKAQTAAVIAAQAERAGVSVNPGLFKGLSKATRADIKAAVKAQMEYLDKFDISEMSEAAVRARAAMYAGSVRATYGKARYPGLPFYPGEGTECLSNCRCGWQDNGDDSYTWALDAKESCATCLERADGSPYQAGDE